MPREGGGGGRGRQHLPPRYRLLLLLREGFFVKGSEMAKALGISKTAVWKHISSLRREGYPIEARKKVGYRLVGSPGKLLPFEVAWGLKTKRIARSVELVHHRDLVDSTQNWAKFEAER
ncbi:MAG TPA: bifunctional biotin--[acetyl-CoA-carboxylase] synthetase/biotin operon repressor, partial [Armatimonadetes bacterium]|nr:bifunctional biotin--[acetyl-CoA-carboxylase] synthetase/biotin operon repressor [Armatimonadota bacterium]